METKTKMRVIIKVAIYALIIIAITAGIFIALKSKPQPEIKVIDQKQEQINQIKSRPEFIERINQEAEKIYYKEVMDEASKKLNELEGFEVSRAKKVMVLQSYLAETNPSLVKYAEEIVELPRWIEVMGIISKETSTCTAGVGTSRNNCGAIKNSKTGQFKKYNNKLESIQDVAILLQKPAYVEKTIAEMNGLYCQDSNRPGRQCEGWTEHILAVIEIIKLELT